MLNFIQKIKQLKYKYVLADVTKNWYTIYIKIFKL